MRYTAYIILLAGAFLFVPIAKLPVMEASQRETTQAQHGMGGMSMMQDCPMQLPGAEVSIQDTNDGIALTITTPSGDVAELRRRLESMAKMHSNDGMHGSMMPFSVTYEEIQNGARLTLKPRDPTKLQEFRSTVRQHAEQMKKHDCSMMQGMMMGMRNSGPMRNPESKSDESDHNTHHPGEKK